MKLSPEELAYEALRLIEKNPQHWNQKDWHCGTTHCFGGFIEIIVKDLSFEEDFTDIPTYGIDTLVMNSLEISKDTFDIITSCNIGTFKYLNFLIDLIFKPLSNFNLQELAIDHIETILRDNKVILEKDKKKIVNELKRRLNKPKPNTSNLKKIYLERLIKIYG